jgi:DNA-binding MarR family transcriptional regulator
MMTATTADETQANGETARTDRSGAEPSARSPSTQSPIATDAELPARLRAAIGKLSRRLRPTIAGSGLSPSEISVLFSIDRRGPLRLSELASIEAINPTMLSRIVGRLVQTGLIRRIPDVEDRRVGLVESTPAGRRMRKRIHRERTQALQTHLRDLDPEEQAALWTALPALERLAQRIGERAS